jgi:hypothetical protein
MRRECVRVRSFCILARRFSAHAVRAPAHSRKEVSVSWKDTSIPHLLGYGSVLYVVEQLLMYPSDLLKTRLQVDLRPESNLSKVQASLPACDACAPCACMLTNYFRGWRRDQDWWVLCKHIYKHEGWRGFFRGFGAREGTRMCPW